MSGLGWRWIAASVTGEGHLNRGERRQDAFAVRAIGADMIVAVVSDGAGSASHGRQGAWMTCRALCNAAQAWQGIPQTDECIHDAIDALRDHIDHVATQRGLLRRQFAATMIGLILTQEDILVLHVGDSALAGRHEGTWELIAQPENGEYASTTWFVTDDPAPRLNILRGRRRHDAFALFSDGVGDLAIRQPDITAHQGFFAPMIQAVDAVPQRGKNHALSHGLKAWLDTASVRARSDDDKSLVLISGKV